MPRSFGGISLHPRALALAIGRGLALKRMDWVLGYFPGWVSSACSTLILGRELIAGHGVFQQIACLWRHCYPEKSYWFSYCLLGWSLMLMLDSGLGKVYNSSTLKFCWLLSLKSAILMSFTSRLRRIPIKRPGPHKLLSCISRYISSSQWSFSRLIRQRAQPQVSARLVRPNAPFLLLPLAIESRPTLCCPS